MKKQFRYISVSLAFLLLLQLIVFGTSSKAYATSGPLRIQMYMGSTASAAAQISPRFKIYNDGTSSIDMSNVKLRYYYTKDSSITQNFACDSFLNDNAYTDPAGITHNFTDMTSPLSNCDNYLEIGFPAGVNLAPNKCIELQTRIYKQDNSNYDQSNDYSFNPTSTTYGDWDKVTAYTPNHLSWGMDPNGAPSKKFLVIVSSKIIDYCSNEINQYMSDISAEGWAPTLIKVNNEADAAHPDALVCPTAQALKDVIKTYYDQGCEGFVIIGSTPSIPCAIWRRDPSSTDQGPTDLFYADMGDWTDIGNDGVYESRSADNQPANPVNPNYTPDMIYGRISAGAISDSNYQLEGSRTAAYLSKIHDYRLSGNMSCDPKAFLFVDDEFVNEEKDQVSYMQDLEQDVYSIKNKASSNKAAFMQFLQGGYRMGYEIAHAAEDSWVIATHPYGTEDFNASECPTIDDINNLCDSNNMAAVKVNYIHLCSCSACNYNLPNIGAAFLFNNADTYSSSKNSYVYNVTGFTMPSNFPLNASYYEDLKSTTIGTSFKNRITAMANSGSPDCPIYILLGDPTLNYNFTKPENKCPYVSNDLSDVNVYPGKPLKLTFNTTDPENDTVYADVTGLPAGATYDSSTKTLDWMPLDSQVGNSYNVTVTAYNKDTSGVPFNKYVQMFTIFVSRMTWNSVQIDNPGFESLNPDGTPSGWTSINGEFSSDSTVKHSGNYSASITSSSDSWRQYKHNTTVEPNTHYLISGYIKTSNVTTSSYGRGACFYLTTNSNSSTYSVPTVGTGTQDWTPVYLHWYSGDSTILDINCLLDGIGTAWFDDIKLEKDLSLGFERINPNVFSPLDENSFTNWTKYSLNQDSGTRSHFWQDSDIKYSGLRSGVIYSTRAPNYAYLNTQIAVDPNCSYRVGVWMRTQDVLSQSTGAYLEAQCGTASAETGSVSDSDFAWYANNSEPDPTEWKMMYLDIATGTNTTMNIYCKLGASTDLTSGMAWFDNITVTKTYDGNH